MKRKIGILAVLLGLGLLGGSSAMAQVAPPSSDSIDVTATNTGAFLFTINQTSLAFGNVNTNATTSNTNVTAVSSASGATYTSDGATGAVTWTCESSPRRTVTITNDAVAGTHSGGIDRGQLGVRITNLVNALGGANVTAAYTPVNTTAALLTGATTGDGTTNTLAGNLLFQLTVDDTDTTVPTTWTVTLTASGT